MTLKEKFVEAILIPFENQGFYIDLDKVEECKKIADEYAIEFLEWFDKNAYSRGENSFLLWDNDKEPLTPKQLLEIFKKEKGL
jgi:hypothetical protein